MYLLDTNHCTFIIEGEPTVIEQFRTRIAVPVVTSAVAAGELYFMAQNSQQQAANRRKIQAFLQRIDVLPISLEVADIYGEFKTKLLQHYGPRERSRRRTTRLQEIGISENDLWIAATALCYSVTVVSADRDFERMQQVQVFNVESWV